VVYCGSTGIDDEKRIILPTWNNSVATGDVLRDIVVKGIAGNGSTPLIRRSVIERVGGYDRSLTLCEDWKFYTELAGVCEFAVVSEYLTGYRLRSGSASSNVHELERAIEGVTEWIWQKWPWLPTNLKIERAYIVDTYLTFLAIRERQFGYAVHLLKKAARTKPAGIFTMRFFELWILLLAHAMGLRVYRWQFWRRPPYALAGESSAS
jgi:hypothetical protein